MGDRGRFSAEPLMRRLLLMLALLLVVSGCSFDLVETDVGGRTVLSIVWEQNGEDEGLTVFFQPGSDPQNATYDDVLLVDGAPLLPTARHENGSLIYRIDLAALQREVVTIQAPAVEGTQFRPVVRVEALRLLAPDTLVLGTAGADIALQGVEPRSGGPGVGVEGFTSTRVTASSRISYSDPEAALASVTIHTVTSSLRIPGGLLPAAIRHGTVDIRLQNGIVWDAPHVNYRLTVTRTVVVTRPFVVVE